MLSLQIRKSKKKSNCIYKKGNLIGQEGQFPIITTTFYFRKLFPQSNTNCKITLTFLGKFLI